eukprot:scaffold17088_cov127-Isochrysis_galbana.AAC.6
MRVACTIAASPLRSEIPGDGDASRTTPLNRDWQACRLRGGVRLGAVLVVGWDYVLFWNAHMLLVVCRCPGRT